MKTANDVAAAKDVAAVLEAPGLKGYAERVLGSSKKPVLIATGTVKRVGLAFFDEKKRPQTVFASHITPPEALAASLIAQKIYQFDPAYTAEVKVGEETHEVFLSDYHTKRVHGNVSALSVGDVVDVHVAPKAGGIAFTYTPLKGAK